MTTLCSKCGRRVLEPGEQLGIALLTVHDDIPCMCAGIFANGGTVAFDIETQPLTYKSAQEMLEKFEAMFPNVVQYKRERFFHIPFQHYTPQATETDTDLMLTSYIRGRTPWEKIVAAYCPAPVPKPELDEEA